tara:strand:- start:16365 stop:17327 length:963 start_codon:yes stop_codon:yes gene_type:complete
MEIKHSILVPTYNQEMFIGHALNSIVNQSVVPFEVFIVDDCSTDNTGKIAQEFENKHPFIKYIKHPKNIGLIENFDFVKKLPTGDIISWCSGDDLLAPNILENLNRTILEYQLNLEDNFLIITNSKHLYPSGFTSLWDNYADKDKGAFWARLRQGLSFRGVGFSNALYCKTKSEKEILPLVESRYALDVYKGFHHINDSDRIIFANYTGGIYRVEVGVTKSRSANQNKESCEAMISAFKYVQKHYKDHWTTKDIQYVSQQIRLYENIKNGTSDWGLAWEIFTSRHNYSRNNDALKNMSKLLPSSVLKMLKVVYPIYLKLK